VGGRRRGNNGDMDGEVRWRRQWEVRYVANKGNEARRRGGVRTIRGAGEERERGWERY